MIGQILRSLKKWGQMTAKHIAVKAALMIVPFTAIHYTASGQITELKTGWKCAPIVNVKLTGEELSSKSTEQFNDWQPAVVPGTVLTTLLANKKIPDPFYGLNNEAIKDIYDTGRDHYTYWFVKGFEVAPITGNDQVYLNLRGVNYSCNVFLNGHKLNPRIHQGMFLRQRYNITSLLNKKGTNRVAVIVYPPDPVGKPNGGQGGDGRIAKNVSVQYTAGWDWIQPVRDRNTGIWDKVYLERTGAVSMVDPHVITTVQGVRLPGKKQEPAQVKVSTELQNPTAKSVQGTVVFTMNGQSVTRQVTLSARSSIPVELPILTLRDPKLWWPNGYGEHYLYDAKVSFVTNDHKTSDQHLIKVGVRQIDTRWNDRTQSKEVLVNGQKIFIKGGNWVISDAMLRLSEARYDAEVRFHRDMNLNLIRVWGGAIMERPEFYDACDRYGMLVFQDFWISADANGKWLDPLKADDQWTRRKYPDDHQLFLRSAADQIKMVRNHASLAIWCGGNEITPPADIMIPLRDSILPKLDGTRWFVDYSNSDQMSLNKLGGNGDGPYNVQPISVFWDQRTYPFNSEVGSVGMGDIESLKRFIPEKNLVMPQYSEKDGSTKTDPVWDYHKYIGYDGFIEPYGKPKDVADMANKAQLVNYDQYRALMEGFSSHMWEWYTGTVIWKTQNPWTALRGQMYDHALDPNACLYGTRTGSEPLHVMYDPVKSMVGVVNNTFEVKSDLMLVVNTIDAKGAVTPLTQVFVEMQPSSSKAFLPIKNAVEKVMNAGGGFLHLQLLDVNKKLLSDNLYWLVDADGKYTALNKLPASQLKISARALDNGNIEVALTNPANAPVAFFNRLSVVDPVTHQRLLPVFYDDNYVSLPPGANRKIMIDRSKVGTGPVQISISGWNLPEIFIPIAQK